MPLCLCLVRPTWFRIQSHRLRSDLKEEMNPIISVALETTRKTVMEEVNMLSGLKEQVEGMKTEIQWMQSFLQDADLRVTSQPQLSQSKLFRQSVFQVREASLDAEDIIDEYSVKLALRKGSGAVNRIKRYACIPAHAVNMHGIGSDIKALMSKISSLKSSIQAYALKELGLGDGGSSSSSSGHAKSLQRPSYGHIHDRNVVGLEENIGEVVDLLLKEENANNVLSIYGMGGLGKTTLAKKVYNDKRVRTHFDKFAWVYVSQQFKERDVWESTLAELSGYHLTEISRLTENQLLSRLRQLQKDQKCLVVLDDVWSIGDWNRLQHGFHDTEETTLSRILFTTRNKEVAEHANHRCSYGGLKPLDENKSLELLRKIALRGRDENSDKKSMEDLGEGMLKHCGGLPLAIVVLGGILVSKHSLIEWQTVHDNINSYLRRGKGHDQEQGLGVHQVLAYSYYDLPSRLKTCFLYLSQFPEDHEIKTGELMRMWIAEGFVSVQYDGEGEETMGDVAERYLNELVGRCVIEIGRKGPMGRVKTCRLHDLMREVCLAEAKEESLIHNFQREGTISKVVPKGKIRRLAFFADCATTDDLVSLSHYGRNSQIRSLILTYDDIFLHLRLESLGLVRLLNTFKLLKMLVLERIDMGSMKGLSKEIGKMIHLRYLSLRNSWIHAWPSLDKLECMETLDLRVRSVKSSGQLKVNDIWKMKSLMHLYLPPTLHKRYSTDGGVDRKSMSNVQTLVNFPPRKGRVSGIVKFPNLKKLQVLQGKHVPEFWDILKKGFSLSRLYSFALTSEGLIPEKVELEVLFERCPHLYKLRLDGAIDKFPRLNQFPTKLTKLILQYSGIEDPKHIETTLGNLPHLKSLELWEDSFKGDQLSFKKHTFPQLTTLSLLYLHELKNWTVEEGAMPNLECLQIHDVKKLEAIPEGLRFIATLKELYISWMPAEFKARLEEGGADFDKVKHVPFTFFYSC